MYLQKYLKYKAKYVNLKYMLGGNANDVAILEYFKKICKSNIHFLNFFIKWAYGSDANNKLLLIREFKNNLPMDIVNVILGNIADTDKILYFLRYNPILSCRHNAVIISTIDELYGWGFNMYGQLGINKRTSKQDIIKIEGINNIMFIASGERHTIISTEDDIYGSGNNSNGQLGLGDMTNRTTFEKIKKGDFAGKIISVFCGNYHTILLTTIGLYGCGSNIYNELGFSNKIESNRFQKIPTNFPDKIDSIFCNGNSTIIITKNRLYVCGSNGKLGKLKKLENVDFEKQETYINRIEYDFEGDISLVSGGDQYTIVVTTSGLYVSGENSSGQLGLGDVNSRDTFEKIAMDFDGDIISISCGMWHTMVLTTSGLYASGDNSNGQLGNGTYNKLNKFQKIFFEGNIVSISCGHFNTMLLTTDGLYVCGSNDQLQLGIKNILDNSNIFVKVPLNVF